MENQPGGLSFRRAQPAEAPILSEIAFRSKAYWGYDAEFMAKAREELVITAEAVRTNLIYTAVSDEQRILGFYELTGHPPVIKLSALFIDPAVIRRGIGRKLFAHALKIARKMGAKKLLIDSDPNAKGFYESMGAVQMGEVPSGSIPGRMLPLLEIEI
ncbi:GNAT family N-acetyltransferase [Lihuaxuella thermophila]|uniref:Acetyltransferase (GNAT) domain-containing protein n=1 Tax=Lihuaxuella thermophila TaxID=1173111 RepID=A0A1H8HG70_9BACL|nr:GNAT family N-acetyltransferase [Lihuaxuella thermophila]SEN55156.1 Acetyltransferase (GNAT) domain-containing protein [Lihuaxuella thermophila]